MAGDCGTEGAWGWRAEAFDMAEDGRCNGTVPLTGLALLDDEPPVGFGEMPFMPESEAVDPCRGSMDIDGGLGRLGRRW